MCNLLNTCGNYSCTVRKNEEENDIFIDMNTFEVSLCHKQNDEPEICEVLDDNFKPVTNSKKYNDFGLFS